MLLPTSQFVLLLQKMCYCQLHNLFYCYSNCATVNFTICFTATVSVLLSTSQFVLLLQKLCSHTPAYFSICSTATVTVLLCYCQLHNLFYCYSKCATVNFRASVRRTYAVYYVQKSAAYAEITHQRRTADF